MNAAHAPMELLESRTLMSVTPVVPHRPEVPASSHHIVTPTPAMHHVTFLSPAPAGAVRPVVPTRPVVPAAPHHVVTPTPAARHVTFSSPAPTHVVKPVVTPKAKFTTPVTPTVKLGDPQTTEKQITYKSFAGDPLFAPAGPTIKDVNQGYLGDCYLMSTLSSIAKTDPALIRQDVVADGDGVFSVKFAGKTETVNADLPVWSDGRPAYAGLGQDDSLWVAVVEKAYVLYKSGATAKYANINGGYMGDVFAAFGLKSTGVFTETDQNALATTLAADLASGDFVTLGTRQSVPTDSPFVPNHAYEVDGVTTNSAGKITAITLRNPWGANTANDGYITVTPFDAMSAFTDVVVSHT